MKLVFVFFSHTRTHADTHMLISISFTHFLSLSCYPLSSCTVIMFDYVKSGIWETVIKNIGSTIHIEWYRIFKTLYVKNTILPLAHFFFLFLQCIEKAKWESLPEVGYISHQRIKKSFVLYVCVESLRNNLHRERFYRQREFNNRSKEERTDKAQLVKYANETELKSVKLRDIYGWIIFYPHIQIVGIIDCGHWKCERNTRETRDRFDRSV